jgi:hypothetical protein
MSTIRPGDGPPERRPSKSDRIGEAVMLLLKVIGVLAIVVLIAGGIILGTCFYGLRR